MMNFEYVSLIKLVLKRRPFCYTREERKWGKTFLQSANRGGPG
jgi:hypothetical protein